MCQGGNPAGQYQVVSSPEMMKLREKFFPYLISGLKRGATRNPNDIVAKTPEMGIQAMNLMQQMYAGDAFKSPGGTGLQADPRPHVTPASTIQETVPMNRPLSGGGSFEPINAAPTGPRPMNGPAAGMDPTMLKLLSLLSGQGNEFNPIG